MAAVDGALKKPHLVTLVPFHEHTPSTSYLCLAFNFQDPDTTYSR